MKIQNLIAHLIICYMVLVGFQYFRGYENPFIPNLEEHQN